jgi:protein-S-isoprenylcysteine O-methyltransferase Ste14
MSIELLAFYLLAFLVMWVLPQVFFRREDRQLTLMWVVTASPYVVVPVIMVLLQRGIISPLVAADSDVGRAMQLASVPFVFAYTGMVFATMFVHRVPLALWHQPHDAPKSIVTWGPYRFVRHPFYASFLLLLTGSVLAAPHPVVIAMLVVSFFLLNYTAAREEKRLSASSFGAEYVAYLSKTGRFVPRVGG